ncbi:MAG TPA: hypothetical protein DD670_20470 [Planctomycetaceae bacterium]|nr:hypothetical protein [Planctomycetaceae bacterium]
MTGREIAVPVSVVVETKPEVRVERTLIFQRPAIGPGLRWTVRGYAVGKLDLDGEPYDAILADGNANVTFGTIGRDRVWIDLNRDGRFDALTEQFPLGKPVRKGDRIYVVRSNRLATKVSAVAREPGEGKIRLELAHDMKVEKVSAELISDLGELVEIDSIDKATPVPHGTYYIASLVIKTTGDDGQPWFYTFSGKNRKRHDVAIGDEATVALLDGLDMRVEIGYSGKNEAKPGETVRVQPEVVTSDGSLVLKSCTVGSEDSRSSTEAAAVILFLSPEGETLSRGTSGFG